MASELAIVDGEISALVRSFFVGVRIILSKRAKEKACYEELFLLSAS